MRAWVSLVVAIGAVSSIDSTRAAEPALLKVEPSKAHYHSVRNLVSNPSFEMDWMHNEITVQTRFLLLEQSDWGYGQADGQPDSWIVPPRAYRDATTARFGRASLRLHGTASQVIYLCGETDPRDGGAHYNVFRPLPQKLIQSIKQRPLRFGAWCKTQDATSPPSLAVTVEYVVGGRISPRTSAVSFAKGTHDWEYREIRISPAPDAGVAHAAVFRLSHQGTGDAWFDGILAEETADPDEINLLPNGGFEEQEKDWPAGWSRPVLWTWSRRDYYRFTGWSHEKGKMAGGAVCVPLSHRGERSLQLTVLPGDNLAVRSASIRLNQKAVRPLEASTWVRADNLRWLEVMAQDEQGEWLPQQDFAGCMGTDAQYPNRVLGTGSHDWEYLRKYFAPQRPVKELTLWLCARGFDGKRMARNIVGTVWFDDVELRECGSPRAEFAKRGIKIPAASKPFPEEPAYRVVDLDLGERLWGDNTLRLRLQNSAAQAAKLDGDFKLLSPSRQTLALEGKPVTLPPKQATEVAVPYRLTELASDWQHHYRLDRPWPLAFGTPASPIALRQSASYVYPDEMLDVGVNLEITARSLRDVASCRIAIRHPRGEKELLRTTTVARAFWAPGSKRPALLAGGFVDARNLIVVSTDSAGLPIHAHANPVRDCRVEVVLKDRDGKVIATQTGEPFGFLEKPSVATLPDRIERTSVSPNGTILVNGKPFVFNCFPHAATDLGNVSRMLNFPRTHKIMPLPFPSKLTFKADEEDAWKRKVQDFVRANRGDPKLFGYSFKHDGETTFWLKEWREMAACQRKVAAWVREMDSNHIILGASWLFGHEALTPESARPFGFLDVLDVEPGLTWTPDSQAVRKAAGRPVAVLAGLECYYFQPVDVLRWRVYEALRQGANGIGICPSGMLQARPEMVTFLRGLHGEVEGLQAMLAGNPPVGKPTASDRAVTVWERQAGRTRYLVAMLGDRTLPAQDRRVTFTIPIAARTAEVLFEGRSLTIQGNQFTDPFERPFTVRVYRLSP